MVGTGQVQFHASSGAASAKDLYLIGEIPPLGHVPGRMHAWVIRKERHGHPDTAMRVEVVDTPSIGPEEALIMIMATGIGYNSIWASLGKPVSPLDIHRHSYHICGGEAAGIIWAVGDRVKQWKVGDEVVLHSHRTTETTSSAMAAIPCCRLHRGFGVMKPPTAHLRNSRAFSRAKYYPVQSI